MPSKGISRTETEQCVQHPAVANVDFRCAYLTLLQVLEPRRQHAHHASRRKDVQIAPRGGLRAADRPGELGSIPDLTVIVGHHRPEATQRLGRHIEAEVRDVAQQKGLNERLAPQSRIAIGACEVAARKSAPPPESAPIRRGRFGDVEPGQLDHAHAPGERLGRAPQQPGRSASEQQEARRDIAPIKQHAQRLEELGIALDLVDDDETRQRRKRLLRRLQALPIGRPLKIEERRGRIFARAAGVGTILLRERRLAALAWPGEGDRWVDAKGPRDSLRCLRAWNQHG